MTLLATVLALFLPGFPLGHCTQDFIAVLDGAYRITRGQVPHVDFSLATGSLVLAQGAVALKLAPWIPPFATMQLTLWLLLAPVVWRLMLRQPPGWPRALVLASVALVALVPYVVTSEPLPDFNFNALYNRSASLTLLLGFVWALTPRRRGAEDVLIAAWLLLLALLWKSTHVVVLGGVMVLSALASPVARAVLVRALLLVAAVLVLLDLSTGGMMRGYARDIVEMMSINRGGIARLMLFLAVRSLPALAALAVLLVLLAPRGPLPKPGLRAVPVLLRRWRGFMLSGALALGLLATESQGTGNLALYGLVALPLLVLRQRVRHPLLLPVAMLVAALGAYPMLESISRRLSTELLRHAATYRLDPALEPVIGRSLVSRRNVELGAAYAALWKADPARIDAYRKDRDTFTDGTNATEVGEAHAWLHGVAEMAQRARASGQITPQTRIATIGYVEPFARILGAQAARGTRLWLDFGRTVGPLSPEQAAQYLADADVVFVQQCPARQSLIDLVNQPFGETLKREFRPGPSTLCYAMWVRARAGA